MNADGEWERWRRAVFGDPYQVWNDGPDFTALLAAVRAEPRAVERMLRAGLLAGDPLAAHALAHLATEGRAPADAVSYLRTALGRADGTFRIRVAEALYVLTRDPSWARPIAGLLTGATSETVRLDAAIALAAFPPNGRLVEALTAAVRDPEYLVRYHAANTLLRLAGDRRSIDGHPALLHKITDGGEGSWRAAADELAARICP